MQRIGVLLCECEGKIAGKVGLAEVSSWLTKKTPETIKISDTLCKKPSEIVSFIRDNGLSRIVVGACKKCQDTFDDAANRAGLTFGCIRTVDIFGQCVSVHSGKDAGEKAKILLAAAINRERASGVISAENIRFTTAQLNKGMSRRTFLTFPMKLSPKIIPSVNESLCVAWRGCDLCIESCPGRALFVAGRKIQIDTLKCEGCGVCVGACPADALVLPTYSANQMDKEIHTLVAANSGVLEPRIILFACSGGASVLDNLVAEGFSYPTNMLLVEIPCIGMITSFWMLRALQLGAEAVVLIPCQEKCIYGYEVENLKNMEVANQLLRILDFTERIHLINANGKNSEELHATLVAIDETLKTIPSSRTKGSNLSKISGVGTNLSHLVKHMAESNGVKKEIRNSKLPFWTIEVDTMRCSICGLCASHCPTKSMNIKQEETTVRLMFDCSLCNACGICLRTCPNDAIKYKNVLDFRKLDSPESVLIQGKMARCENCGTLFMPQRQIEMIASRVSAKSKEYPLSLSKFCPNCRLSRGIAKVHAKTNSVRISLRGLGWNVSFANKHTRRLIRSSVSFLRSQAQKNQRAIRSKAHYANYVGKRGRKRSFPLQ